MAKDGETIEQMMKDENCNGKRVTIDSIKANIEAVDY